MVDSPSPAQFVEEAPYTFAVDKWIKGDLGTEVVVFAPSQGSACGFEAPIGERVGVFVTIEGGTPTGSLCSMVDPDLLMAGDQPFELDGSGPPLFLVTGYSGRARLMLLDAGGGLLAMVGNEGENLHGLTTCPGSGLFVEMVNDQLVVRSTADLGESPGLPTADGIGWVDDTKFLAYSYPVNSDEVDNLMIDTESFEMTNLAELPGYQRLRTGDQLVGVTGATLKVMSISGGELTSLRVLPSETHHLAAVLDQVQLLSRRHPRSSIPPLPWRRQKYQRRVCRAG